MRIPHGWSIVPSLGPPDWLARFAPGALEDDLKNLGFSQVAYFSHKHAWERYLKERTDGLSLNPMMQLMSAIV